MLAASSGLFARACVLVQAILNSHPKTGEKLLTDADSGKKRRLHRECSGGADDYQLLTHESGAQLLASRAHVVPSCWVAAWLPTCPRTLPAQVPAQKDSDRL